MSRTLEGRFVASARSARTGLRRQFGRWTRTGRPSNRGLASIEASRWRGVRLPCGLMSFIIRLRRGAVDRLRPARRSRKEGELTHEFEDHSVNELRAIARALLERRPGVVVRLRLLRDILDVPSSDPDVRALRAALPDSLWVRGLGAEQREDGGWGDFHSRSSGSTRRVPSTEVGVERAVALGLEREDPIPSRAHAYLLSLLEGVRPFPDRAERNDRWATGSRLFAAATLSLIDPASSALEPDRTLWREIASRALRTGSYREEDDVAAHAELTGATIRGSYLVLSGRYQLNLLGSVSGLLPAEIEESLLAWLWGKPDGIGYLGERLPLPAPEGAGRFDRWLSSHELLARCFPAWGRRAGDVVDWLCAQRSDEGFWDFGPRGSTSTALPLSDSWRTREARIADWTSRVLFLLRRFHGEA